MQMLIHLLHPTGPELARRWLAALTVVPETHRVAIVEAVEQQIHSEFGNVGDEGTGAAAGGSDA